MRNFSSFCFISECTCDDDISSTVSTIVHEVAAPTDQIHILKQEVKDLHRKLRVEQVLRRKGTVNEATLKRKLKKLFNHDQLNNMCCMSPRSYKWSRETYKEALKLRFACGTAGYDELLKQGHPLPCLRSLHCKMEVVSMEPGILDETFIS